MARRYFPLSCVLPASTHAIVTTLNYALVVKYVPDWMPGAHFKQVAKQSRAVCKKFIDEPFEEIEKQVVSI